MTTTVKSKALSSLVWSAIERFSVQGTQFVVTILLARLISPSDFGLIGMITVFIILSDLIINAGFSQALIQKVNRTQVDYSTVFYFNIFIAFLLYILIYISAPLVSAFYNQPVLTEMLRVLALSIVLKSFCVVQNAIISIELNFKLRTKINLVSALISGAIAIILALNSFGVYALIYQAILFSTLVTSLSFILIKWFPALNFSFSALSELFRFGSKLLIASIVRTIVDNSYAILIGRFVSIKEVGYYTQGRNIPDVISMNLFTVLQNVFFPLMSTYQNDKNNLIKIYAKGIEGTALIIIPAMLGLIFIAKPFVSFFLGNNWEGAVIVIQWIALSRIIIPISALNCSIMNAIGRSDIYLKVDLIKLPLTVGALLLTFPYGLKAIVVGNSIVSALCFFINAYYPGKWFGFGAIKQLKIIFPILIAATSMCMILFFINIHNPLYEILAKLFVGAIIYGVSCYILKIPVFMELLKLLAKKINVKGKL